MAISEKFWGIKEDLKDYGEQHFCVKREGKDERGPGTLLGYKERLKREIERETEI